MRRTLVAALRSNGAQRQRRTEWTHCAGFTFLFLRINSSPSWILPGRVPCSLPDKLWTYTRIMGIYYLCARTRGSIILSWWKPCHRSRGPWDRTGQTRWRETARRFPTTKRYRSRFSVGPLVLMECWLWCGLFAHSAVRCALSIL